MSQPTRCSS